MGSPGKTQDPFNLDSSVGDRDCQNGVRNSTYMPDSRILLHFHRTESLQGLIPYYRGLYNSP
jgi:hypothetical protein